MKTLNSAAFQLIFPSLNIFLNRISHVNLFLLAVLVIISNPVTAEVKWDIEPQARIVAIGDIHGAYQELIEILQTAKIIDENNKWVAGNTDLVSLGDLIDRGAQSRKVLDLMINLQQEAALSGGAVHIVLGNHELMVMTGDMRYVSDEEFSSYTDLESDDDRNFLYEQFLQQYADLPKIEAESKFNSEFPPGFIGLQYAMSNQGKYGKWLRDNAVPVLKIGDNLFVHGGLSTELLGMTLEEVNTSILDSINQYTTLVDKLQSSQVLPVTIDFLNRAKFLNIKLQAIANQPGKKEIPPWYNDAAKLMELNGSMVFSEKSPLWYRGTAFCHSYSESFNTESVLKQYDVSRVVVGHSPRFKAITQRMEGLAVLADTGMLQAVYKGTPSALIIENGVLKARYASTIDDVDLEMESVSPITDTFGLSDMEIEDFLRTADVIDKTALEMGITKSHQLTLKKGRHVIKALFKTLDTDEGLETAKQYLRRRYDESDRYLFEVAAYKLDRMLGLNLIPVAVTREIGGEKGMLQIWLDDTIPEVTRNENETPFNSYCEQFQQYRLRIVFDILIHNDDRNLGNILWSNKDHMLRLIDQTQAFRSKETRPRMYRRVPLEVSELFRRKLETLTIENLNDTLSNYLHPRQIEAIIKRRDLILKEAERI